MYRKCLGLADLLGDDVSLYMRAEYAYRESEREREREREGAEGKGSEGERAEGDRGNERETERGAAALLGHLQARGLDRPGLYSQMSPPLHLHLP